MKRETVSMSKLLRNERGSVLIFTLLILVLLTVIGIAASTTTNFEVQLASNERDYQGALYAAEAGVAYARGELKPRIEEENAANLASGQGADLQFVPRGVPSAWTKFSSYEFQYVYQDGGDPKRVRVISEGRGPRGITASVEVLIEATGTGATISGYSAQEGAGAGKNYDGNDIEAISSDDIAKETVLQ